MKKYNGNIKDFHEKMIEKWCYSIIFIKRKIYKNNKVIKYIIIISKFNKNKSCIYFLLDYSSVIPVHLSIIKLKHDKKIRDQWNYYIIMSLCLIYQVILRYIYMSFIIFTILSICYLIFV